MGFRIKYLLKRSGKYYFRTKIPLNLQHVFHRIEIQRSLKTSRLDKAITSSMLLADCFHELFKTVQYKSLSLSEINFVIDAVLKDSDKESPSTHIIPDRQPQNLIGNTSISFSPSRKTSQGSLQFYFDMFVSEKSGAKNWGKKTTLMMCSAIQLIVDVFGKNKNVSDISRQDLLDFRNNILVKLPANKNKNPKYRKKSISELVSMNIPVPMTIRTADNSIRHISSLFKWCYDNSYIAKNPCVGLRFARSTREDQERSIYTKEEIEKIITCVIALPEKSRFKETRWWVVLLGLYQGMRLNEICQLYLDEVIQVDGIPCFNISATKSGQKLKNKSSVRIVPIHPLIISLGFLDYVDELKTQNEVRLWSILSYIEVVGYCKKMIEWFMVFNRRHITSDKRKVFHSFRHNFATELKNKNVPEVAIAELLGHKNSSITTGRYGKPFHPQVLLEHLSKLDYGIDVFKLKENIESCRLND